MRAQRLEGLLSLAESSLQLVSIFTTQGSLGTVEPGLMMSIFSELLSLCHNLEALVAFSPPLYLLWFLYSFFPNVYMFIPKASAGCFYTELRRSILPIYFKDGNFKYTVFCFKNNSDSNIDRIAFPLLFPNFSSWCS